MSTRAARKINGLPRNQLSTGAARRHQWSTGAARMWKLTEIDCQKAHHVEINCLPAQHVCGYRLSTGAARRHQLSTGAACRNRLLIILEGGIDLPQVEYCIRFISQLTPNVDSSNCRRCYKTLQGLVHFSCGPDYQNVQTYTACYEAPC